MFRLIIYMIFIVCGNTQVHSQEAPIGEAKVLKAHHRITSGLGHTHLVKGINNSNKKVWLPVPSWSLNYDYQINNKWACGLQTDMVLEKYIVEEEGGDKLERKRPLSVVPVGIFKPWKHFSFLAGAGIELEKEKSLGMTRLGMDYVAELSKGWEAGSSLCWDYKLGRYTSWMLAFCFSKTF